MSSAIPDQFSESMDFVIPTGWQDLAEYMEFTAIERIMWALCIQYRTYMYVGLLYNDFY